MIIMNRYLTTSTHCILRPSFVPCFFHWHRCAEESLNSKQTLERAGENADQIRTAIKTVPSEHREGLEFLLRYMPERDLQQLSSDYLLENVQYAYKAWHESPWKDQISKDVFLNNILPYASINERRDNWRRSFYETLQTFD
jgi:hypothetical protein